MQIRIPGIVLAILIGAAPSYGQALLSDSAEDSLAGESAVEKPAALFLQAGNRGATAASAVGVATDAASVTADSASHSTAFGQSTLPAGIGTGDILPEDSNVPDSFSLMVRMAVSLGVVLLVIWGALVLLRRMTGGSGVGRGASNIRVLDRSYLAPKRAVYVVQVGNRTLALGVTDTQISPLAELNEGEFPTELPAQRVAAIPFANILDSARRKFGRDVSPKADDDAFTTGASS